jgi:predicted amidohydrolase
MRKPRKCYHTDFRNDKVTTPGKGAGKDQMGIRIGMGQMRVVGGAPETNLMRAAAMISEAARAGCDVVVLPECLDLGWTHPSAFAQAETIPGSRVDRLAATAREHRIHVVAGLTEAAGEKVYNAAVLLDSEGSLLLTHRKINILDIASDLYSVGDRVGVAETAFGKVGLLICADNFPESLCLGESLARMGARLILSPCAWAVPASHDNLTEPYGDLWRRAYHALTKGRDLAVVGVSNVGAIEGGPWDGRQCIGCSLAYGPGGRELLQAPYGVEAEGLYVVEIETS